MARRAERTAEAGDETTTEYREVADEALAAMAEGGIFDHVGGGFHRYTVDREWVVPHFEKMLYDNAELPSPAMEDASRRLATTAEMTGIA
ncbi:MAG: hypothetical protein BRD48_02645 [Bacteroidetes bacterium QS_9_68_14]|nr:MAG: hypothetical protein BRD48_02645 [Bacteroidetes bacterium QS_9_68_14]